MEIRNLVTFLHVAELNSFTKAAQALNYSQSTVSFQIKQLETELGCLLFDRINHTLLLTGEGAHLLEYAQKICHLTDDYFDSLSRDKQVSGLIRVVTPDSVCEAMLLENYADFHSLYPDIRLQFTTDSIEGMFLALNQNQADVMLTLDTRVYDSNYIIAKESPTPIHFVTGAHSPYAAMKNLTLADVAAFPMILTERGMGYRGVLDKAMAKKSIQLEPALEVGRTDIITRLLENTGYVSFLPDFITKSGVEKGNLVHLDVPDASFDIWQQLIYHKNKWISRALGAFISYVCEKEFDR